MNDVRVSTWCELQERLFESCWQEKILRFRSHFAHRGLADANWDLRTSLMRLGGPYPKLEGHLLRNFRKYAHGQVAVDESVWNWLALFTHACFHMVLRLSSGRWSLMSGAPLHER